MGFTRSFTFESEELVLEQEKFYQDNTPAIQIYCEDGSPFATLTVCILDKRGLGILPPNHFIVKTWSENAPVAHALLEQGIFEDTGIRIPTGFVEAEVWKLV